MSWPIWYSNVREAQDFLDIQFDRIILNVLNETETKRLVKYIQKKQKFSEMKWNYRDRIQYSSWKTATYALLLR